MNTTPFEPSFFNNNQKNSFSNFGKFITKSKNYVLLINIVFIFLSLVITISISKKIQNILWEYVIRYFSTFELKKYTLGIFNNSFFKNIKKPLIFENVFLNYRRYIYGLLFFLTLESISLIIKYQIVKYKWNKYTLSYGIYENKYFARLFNNTFSLLVNVFIFAATIIILFSLLGFIIYKRLIKEFNFENNFFFEVCIFSSLFWLGLSIYIGLNVYQLQYNYHANYVKNNKINSKKIEIWMIWHTIKNFFYFCVILLLISLKIPFDLFLIYCAVRYMPWEKIPLFKDSWFSKLDR